MKPKKKNSVVIHEIDLRIVKMGLIRLQEQINKGQPYEKLLTASLALEDKIALMIGAELWQETL